MRFLALALFTVLSHADPLVQLKDLTDETFDSALQGKKVFVKFFAPWCGHCKAMTGTWNALAGEVPDVHVAEVDCTKDDSKATCQRLEVQGYPTVKLFENNLVYSYEGARDLNSLKSFANEGYKDTKGEPLPKGAAAPATDEHVVVVSDDNIATIESSDKTVMLEFYAPWCGHCKNLEPAYNELATLLATEHPNIIAAKCDATVAEKSSKRYKVRGFPTLKVLKDKKVYDYAGARTANAMLEFLQDPTGDAVDIPGPWSVVEEIKDTMLGAWNDIKIIFEHKRAASVLTYLAGVWTGCLIVSVLSFLLPKPKPRAPVPAGKKDK